jgi:hypothetical protein
LRKWLQELSEPEAEGKEKAVDKDGHS